MTQKEIEKLSEKLREDNVTHLMLVRLRRGITISSIARGDDIYEFLQCMIDTNEACLEIMKEVVESRKRPPKEMVYN